MDRRQSSFLRAKLNLISRRRRMRIARIRQRGDAQWSPPASEWRPPKPELIG